jgi:hypothetical protein
VTNLKSAKAIGIDPPAALLVTPCELASLTSAAGKGASIFKTMDISRHKSVDTLWATSVMPRCSRIVLARGCFESV